MELLGVGVDLRQRIGPVQAVGRGEILEDQPHGFAHQRLQGEGFFDGQSAAREREELAGQILRAQTRFFRVGEPAQRGVAGGQQDFRQRKVAEDDGEQVVEIVRDAAGQLAERFLFAELEQFVLHAAAFGDVTEDEHRAHHLVVRVADRRGGTAGGELRAVVADVQQRVARERQRAGDTLLQRAIDQAVNRRAAGGFEEAKVVVDGLVEDRVVLQPEQAQGGVVGLDHPAVEIGGNHPVGDGPERDRQPFGLGGQRAAGLVAFGHVAVDEDRLPVIRRDAKCGHGGAVGRLPFEQRFGGSLQPPPRTVLGAQPEGGDERDARHDALAEFLHHPGDIVGVDEGGKILPDQFLGLVTEDFLVVGADVGVKNRVGRPRRSGRACFR